jgi:hypothetical protein
LTCRWCGLLPGPPPPTPTPTPPTPTPAPPTPPGTRRLRVGLYAAPYINQPGVFTTSNSALPSFYAHTVGVTDVFLPYVAGAFDVDNSTRMLSPAEARPTVQRYAAEGIAAWMQERPAPAADWIEHGKGAVLWADTLASDVLWTSITVRAAQSYPLAREAGFAGLVYDCEDYFGAGRMWGDATQYGVHGQYFKRGRQLGLVIQDVWTNATVVQVYGVGATVILIPPCLLCTENHE